MKKAGWTRKGAAGSIQWPNNMEKLARRAAEPQRLRVCTQLGCDGSGESVSG